DETGVGDQLELEVEPLLVTGQSALGKARCLTRGGREVPVATAAAAALGDEQALAGAHHVVYRAILEGDLRTGRDADFEEFAAPAIAATALAVVAALGGEMHLAREVA